MSTLLNTLRLCFLLSILQLTVTTVTGENVPPVARIAEALVHPRTNLIRNLHIRQGAPIEEAVQTCIKNNQCKMDVLQIQTKCITGDTVDQNTFKCMCNEISEGDMSNFWAGVEQCENCLQKETGTPGSGVDVSVEGPKLCKLLQETTDTPDTPSTPTAATEEIATETTQTTITEKAEETTTITEKAEETTTITKTTEETATPETANNQTTTIVMTEKSPTTVLTVVNKTTTLTTVDQTPEATVSRGNSSTTRTTGSPTPSQESDLPSGTGDTGSGAAGSITTAQHGFQTAVWAFGIKLVVVAAFNFIL